VTMPIVTKATSVGTTTPPYTSMAGGATRTSPTGLDQIAGFAGDEGLDVARQLVGE